MAQRFLGSASGRVLRKLGVTLEPWAREISTPEDQAALEAGLEALGRNGNRAVFRHPTYSGAFFTRVDRVVLTSGAAKNAIG